MAKAVQISEEPGGRVARLALLLLLSAGCGTTSPPPTPVEPESPASVKAEAPAPSRKPDPRSGNPMTFEMERGDTVRERFDASGQWTRVELCLKEVSGGEPGSPGSVSYTMRICTEDGRTEAEARRPTKSGKWEVCFTDTVYEVESGGRTLHTFPCLYGTAWEIEVTPDLLDSGRVRFTVGGYWTACTK